MKTNVVSKRAKSIKYAIGDIFYMPLSKGAQFVKLANGSEGEYIVNPNDVVTYGQVTLVRKGYLQIALFDKITKQVEANNIDLYKLKEEKVVFFFELNANALSRGWWPIIGTTPISKGMPFQAYQWLETEAQAYNHPSWEKYTKVIKSSIGAKLLQAEHSYSSGYVQYVAQYHHGLRSEFYPNDNIQNYKVRKAGLVWNVFPEIFSKPKRVNI